MMTLVEYIESEGLRPVRRGSRWWLCCPFHGDQDPSLSVSEKDGGQVWHCYGCKRGGGPAHFVAELKDVPLYEARRLWAGLNGEAPPDGERELLTRIVESLPGHAFLEARGITEGTRLKHHVGYCEDYGELIKRFGLDRASAAALGLFDFSGCMVYPFYDREGVYRVAARSVSEKEYRTSPETSKFHKVGLWGLQLLRGKEAWIFEGYHDAMAARQAGYQALAAAGTDVSPNAWQELREAGVERAVFVPDGDAGGRGWLERLARGAPRDVSIELVALQSGDPDDAILAGTFQALPRLNPFEWFVTYKWGSPSSLAEKCRMLKDAEPVFSRMPAADRAAARQWFKATFGDDESLSYLNIGVKGDPESERVVLANCLYSGSLRLDTVRELEESSFTGELHRRAFALVRDVEATPQLMQVELNLDLSDKVDLVNHKRYLDRVASAARARAVSDVIRTADPDDVGGLVERLYAVTDRTVVVDGAELVHSIMRDVNARVDNPGVCGVEIKGFPSVNRATLGLMPGRLFLLSGNSGHGKTTLACNILDGLVDEWPTLFVSLEMSDAEIMEKCIAIRSGVPSMKIMTGSLEQFEYDAVAMASDSLMHGNLQVITGVTDLHKIVAMATAQVVRRKVRFIFIDYLQLMTMKSDMERWEQLALITKTLKNSLCRKLGVTVVGISQLTKAALKSDVPDAADQAGAYAMLADADHALTCRKVRPEDTKDQSNFMVNLSKNRFGWDDVQVPCEFDRVTQRIREIT